MNINIDAHLFCLGSYVERYVPGGYFDSFSLDEQLEIISGIKAIRGLNMTYPTGTLPDDPVKCREKLHQYGLRVSYVLAENWLDARFKQGAYSAADKAVLRESVALCKRAVDFARAVGADSVLLWPAHDGFDYSFQTDYRGAWQRLVETVTEIAEYAEGFKLAVEPKPKDPRQKQLVNSVGALLHLIHEVEAQGYCNVGGALDVGHAIAAQENMAMSLALLDRAGKLYQIHLNDNHKDADPDLMLGAVNFYDTLELFYYLLQTDYDGWCSIDIISTRDDRAKSLTLAADLIGRYAELANRLLAHKDILHANMLTYEFSKNMDLIWRILFK